jgi:hypothetical protein
MTAAIPAIAVIIIAGTAFVWAVTRHKGRHEQRFGTAPRVQSPVRGLPPAPVLAADYASLATPCPDCGVDHIGKCGPWGPAALPEHASTSMLPVALPLQPLPELLPAELAGEEAAEFRERHRAAMKNGPVPLTIVTDATITPADVDQAYQDALAINQPAAAGPTTGEIFEHLHEGDRCWCLPWKPAPLPQAVVDELNGHTSVDEAIESMFTRAQADQVIALTNGQVTSDA